MHHNVHFLEIRESTGKHHNSQKDAETRKSFDDNLQVASVAHFDYKLPQNVSAIVGKTAFLTCVVKNLKTSQKVNFACYETFHFYNIFLFIET